MKIKTVDMIIQSLKEKYIRKEDNIIYVERLFVAIPMVRYIMTLESDAEKLKYLNYIDPFLNGVVKLKWSKKGGILFDE